MTIESFLAWKTKFESETVKKKVVRDPTKPTGKEMFLNNAALNESDIEFLTSGSKLLFVCLSDYISLSTCNQKLYLEHKRELF